MDQISSHPLYRKHNIDSAMSSLWAFYKKKFVPLFIISLVMAIITQYASTLINFRELQSITDPQEMLVRLKDYIWPIILISLLSLLFLNILQYYVIYNPLGRENTVIRCTLNSLRYFVPFIIIMILYAFVGSFILFIGIMALVIGVLLAALYVVTIYLFFLPVMMSEGPSIANTISRTMKLAHRNFWPNIGWTAVFILIMLVASVLLSGLVLLPFTGSFLKVFSNPQDTAPLMDLASNPLYMILSSVVSALLYPFLPIFSTILYFNGRAREEQAVPYEPADKGPEDRIKIEDLYARPASDKEDNISGEEEGKKEN